jgi:sortase A
VLGELLVTTGLLLVLFCAYQLLWTNVAADRAQGAVTQELREQWRGDPRVGNASAGPGAEVAAPAAARSPAARPDRPAGSARPVQPGQGLALLHLPTLEDEGPTPVLEGVGADVLTRGAGHYPGTAGPGEVGNFAVAGHRTTHGEPFADIDRLGDGDAVVVETASRWLTYVVTGAEIVEPSRGEVLLPVPGRPGAEPEVAVLTLTTCHPRYSAAQRLVVSAVLAQDRDKAAGPPAALAG